MADVFVASCEHQKTQTTYRKVNPDKNCYPFYVRHNTCVSCGWIMATPKQRKKNRKSFNQAANRYHAAMMETHGIYY